MSAILPQSIGYDGFCFGVGFCICHLLPSMEEIFTRQVRRPWGRVVCLTRNNFPRNASILLHLLSSAAGCFGGLHSSMLFNVPAKCRYFRIRSVLLSCVLASYLLAALPCACLCSGCVCRCHDADMLVEILKEKGVPAEPLSDYINAFRYIFTSKYIYFPKKR